MESDLDDVAEVLEDLVELGFIDIDREIANEDRALVNFVGIKV